jgi:ribosomal protein S20
MPHTPSAKKRKRQNEKLRRRNRAALKEAKRAADLLTRLTAPVGETARSPGEAPVNPQADVRRAMRALSYAQKKIDQLANRRVIHRNKAARWKSSLARQLDAYRTRILGANCLRVEVFLEGNRTALRAGQRQRLEVRIDTSKVASTISPGLAGPRLGVSLVGPEVSVEPDWLDAAIISAEPTRLEFHVVPDPDRQGPLQLALAFYAVPSLKLLHKIPLRLEVEPRVD